MRIVYFGLPLGALLLRADGHDLRTVCLSRKDSPGTRRITRAMGERVMAVPKLDDPRVRRIIEAEKPEFLVSWFWTKRIPAEVLRLAPSFGVHPSLLPRHRGPDPYYWAIRSGDAVTGVTAHVLEEQYDTGGILAQRELAIDPKWDAWELAKKLDRPSLALLREVANRYRDGKPPTIHPQGSEGVTRAPEPTDDDLVLDWHRSTDDVLAQIRAAAPWPGAVTFFDETPVIVTRAVPASKFPKALEPGEAAVEDHSVVVRTEDGALQLIAGRDEEEAELDAAMLVAVLLRGMTRPAVP